MLYEEELSRWTILDFGWDSNCVRVGKYPQLLVVGANLVTVELSCQYHHVVLVLEE